MDELVDGLWTARAQPRVSCAAAVENVGEFMCEQPDLRRSDPVRDFHNKELFSARRVLGNSQSGVLTEADNQHVTTMR